MQISCFLHVKGSYDQFFVSNHMICKNVPSDTDDLVMLRVLNFVKYPTIVIQFMNDDRYEIYRQVVILQMWEFKVSEGTACVTWNEEYVYTVLIYLWNSQKRCASFVLFSTSMLSATGKAYTKLCQNEWCYSDLPITLFNWVSDTQENW